MENRNETNREYRDRLFKFIFGNPEHKEWTLSLYNAVNGTDYDDPEALIFNIIENAVYMGMKNDVSFLVAFEINLYEHQSTFNPNMPIRYLVYAGMEYSRFIEENKNYHLYSSALQNIPVPKCICFYNGKSEQEDRKELKLSDAFGGKEGDIEVRVTMININYGHNKELMEKCAPLYDYSYFVNAVEECEKTTNSLAEAVDTALSAMPDSSVLKPYLMSNKAEVRRMFITEYDEKRHLAEEREEGVEEGIVIGREEGREEGLVKGRAEGEITGILKTLIGLVRDGLLSLATAAERAGMSVNEFEEKLKTDV